MKQLKSEYVFETKENQNEQPSSSSIDNSDNVININQLNFLSSYEIKNKNDPYIKVSYCTPMTQKAMDDLSFMNIPKSLRSLNEANIELNQSQFNQIENTLNEPPMKAIRKLYFLAQNLYNQSSIYIKDDEKYFRRASIDRQLKNKLIVLNSDSFQQSQSEAQQNPLKVEVVKQKRNNLIALQSQAVRSTWKRNWLMILYYISRMKKFAQQIKLYYQPILLQPFQIKMIDDISSNQDIKDILNIFFYKNMKSSKKYRQLFKKISQKISLLMAFYMIISKKMKFIIQCIFKYMPLLHNLSNFYIFWETVIFFTCFISFIYLPFEYSFQIKRPQILQAHIQIITPIILGADIFIKFNTKSYEQGTQLEQHIEIAKNYLRQYFLQDFISLIFLIINIEGYQFTHFLFFLRFSRSTRILQLFREQFLLNLKLSGIISLVFLFSFVIFYGHIFACVWNGIGQYEAQFNKGWLVFYQLHENSIWHRYTESFYFSIVTMTTIGYGDITAQTHIEKLLMIFFTFLSCGVFGYSINSIGNILYDFKVKKDIYLQELARINLYFRQYDVSLALQGSARRYIEYLYSEEKQDKCCSLSLITNLSDQLKIEIKKDIFLKRLKLVKLFEIYFREDFLFQLALRMQEKIYSSDQDILYSKEISEPSIRIINSGQVLKYAQYDLDTSIKPIEKLEQGKCFGVTEFFLDQQNSEFCYKSLGITSILSLTLSDFVSVAKQFSDQLEQFQYLRDQVKFQKSFHKIFSYCPSCQQKDHCLTNCRFIFYEGKKSSIISNYVKMQKDYIKQFQRKSKRINFKAIQQQKNIQNRANTFQEDYLHELSDYDFTSEEEEDEEENEEVRDQVIQEQVDTALIPRKLTTDIEYKSFEKISEESAAMIYQLQGNLFSTNSMTGNSSLIVRRKRTFLDKVSTQEESQFPSLNLHQYTQQFDQFENQQPESHLQCNTQFCQNQFQSLLFKQKVINGNSQQNLREGPHSKKQIELMSPKVSPFQKIIIHRLKELKNTLTLMNQSIHLLQNARQNSKQSQQKLQKSKSNVSILLENKKQIDLNQKQSLKFEDSEEEKNLFSYDFEKIEKFNIYYPLQNYDLVVQKIIKKTFQSLNFNFDILKRNQDSAKTSKKKRKGENDSPQSKYILKQENDNCIK